MSRDQRKGNKGKQNSRNNNFTGVEICSTQCDCGKYGAHVSVQYMEGVRMYSDCDSCNPTPMNSFVPVEDSETFDFLESTDAVYRKTFDEDYK